MKIYQRIILLLFKLSAIGISVGIPAWFIYDKLILDGGRVVPLIDVSVALGLVIILLIWSNWLKKIFNRRLQSIDTVEELGQIPQTNFIMSRILKSVEYIFPFMIVAFLVKGIATAWPTQVIYKPFFWLLYCLLGGVLIMVVHDGFKTHFVNLNIVDRNLRLKQRTEVAEQRRALKLNRH